MEPKNEINIKPGCNAGVDLSRRVSHLEDSDDKQWLIIERLQNRLPVWATMVISLLTFLLGCSLTYAGLVNSIGSG